MNDDTGSIERGTVGWDTGEHFDPGTDDNDGHTLVHVTLNRGHDPTRPSVEGRAQGQRIVCQLSGGVFDVPPEGTPVVVAVPAGMAAIPGGPVIIATVRKNPTVQYAEDRSVLDFGPNKHVVIKGKSVTLCDYESPSRYFSVGESYGGGAPGITAMTEKGAGFTLQGEAVGVFSSKDGDAKSVLQLGPELASIMLKGAGFVRLTPAHLTSLHSAEAYVVAGKVGLGRQPSVPALGGPTAPGAPSTSVFVTPGV